MQRAFVYDVRIYTGPNYVPPAAPPGTALHASAAVRYFDETGFQDGNTGVYLPIDASPREIMNAIVESVIDGRDISPRYVIVETLERG